MPLEARLITGLAIATAFAYWATPLAIRAAARFDFYDSPRGYKGHAKPTPYLGGAAVMASFVVALLLLTSDYGRTLPVVAGVALLWGVGTLDDRRDVPWWLRVMVEVGLATALWGAGLGWELGLGGALDLALTVIWLVAVVNAFNLFDNMDGQAATMGLVTAAGLTTLGIVGGDAWLAVAGIALVGACFGFLPHNLFAQPARIFLGDGGSMPLGFAVAALTMIGATEAAAAEWQAVALGLLLVGVPALDTALVVVSRRRRGISLLTGGRDHLTHRARQRLRTAFAVAVALGSAQIVISLLAVAAARGSAILLGLTAIVYLITVAVAVALIDTRIPAVPPAAPAPAPVADSAAGTVAARRDTVPREAPLLALVGFGSGISPLLAGYYGEKVWGAIGLGVIVCLLAVGIARPPRAALRTWIAVAALAGLGLWAVTSALWADSVAQAVLDGNRLLTYAALLGLLILLMRDRRRALWALGAFVAGALVVEFSQVLALLGSGAAEELVGGRLDQPLGYVNGQASFALLALWPLAALAEQRRSALVAGAGLAGVVLSGGLVMLSQSRGAALALLVSIALVVVLVPGRMRRAGVLGLAGGALVLLSGDLLATFDAGSTAALNAAALKLLGLSALAGAAWAALVALERELVGDARAAARSVASGLLVGVAALALLGGVVKSDSIRTEITNQYDAFVNLTPDQGGEQTASRLLSGGGNRYDYWRIAGDAWETDRLLGVGAGNYDQTYFLERTTTEDVRQPHSLLLQTLAELGIPGLLLLLTFVGAVAWAAIRHRAAARVSLTERGLLVAATGMFTAWLAHTEVDWIHLLPGLTGAALIAVAILLRPQPKSEAQRAPVRTLAPRRRALAAAAIVLPVAIAGVSLSRQMLSSHYRAGADAALADGDAAAAIEDADSALRLDSEDLRTYYVKAAAFARLGDAGKARATLEEASRREPGDFLPYALLGDLSVRQRDLDEAAGYYREALRRNPREPALIELADNPASALQE